jgi:hypothetical protein
MVGATGEHLIEVMVVAAADESAFRRGSAFCEGFTSAAWISAGASMRS